MSFLTFSSRLLITCLLCSLVGCEKSTAPSAETKPVPVVNKPATSGPASAALFNADIKAARVLVFSKTKGWRHDSIPAGIAALEKMASEQGFSLVATEDAELFTDAQLSSFNAIVFLNTTLDVLDDEQQVAMERFIQAGGGFVGIHAAADTEWEGDWFWYRKLVGAVFKNHPNEPSNVQKARVSLVEKTQPVIEGLQESFELADEWYNYRDLSPFNKVLLNVDEKTYKGGEHGDSHPIAWYHDFDGGRAFYTGMGHSVETYSDGNFLKLLLGGLKYAVGGKPKLDYGKASPEANRFLKKTLVDHLNEPVQLSFFANGDALIAERGGSVKLVEYKTGNMREVGKIEVDPHGAIELGLLGFAIDPNFDRNNNIYATLNVQRADGTSAERLSRFKWKDGKLDVGSQEVLWEYPIDQNCCHTGGDLEFGNNGELFVSTGDNSSPFTQEGYGPIDFRPDFAKSDALRSSGNTQDLRGKILRIIPKESGGYDIPSGNLFSDPKDGRPEIYVMGTRNPYKITYDKPSATLYYGDIGPDAGEDSPLKGTRGYDEINRVTKAGNFGWPLFVGNNNAYKDFDYATGKSHKFFDPAAPENNSPRNTGAKILPPAQPPLIWYPYGDSELFPEMGKGGRMALVANVYHANDYAAGEHRYPEYYNNKLFILDFMRNWVKVISMNENGQVTKIEPFAPQVPYVSPIDARFAPDGTLYVIEYGKAWFKGNPEASLSRIEYVGSGNRPPVAKMALDKLQGAAPYNSLADAAPSVDLDGDKLGYRWSLIASDGKVTELGSEKQQQINIPSVGEYKLKLRVKDSAGAVDETEAQLQIGNEPANIDIALKGNRSFYWPTTKNLQYAVTIHDQEDGVVTSDLSRVIIEFATRIDSEAGLAQGHQAADVATVATGLMTANGCKACHSLDAKIVGPAFKDVAIKYKGDKKALEYLVNKIGKGGNGVWGETNMPSFATLSSEERTALATYILSLADGKKTLPLEGSVSIASSSQDQKALESNQEPASLPAQKYELSASYTDRGTASREPITVKKSVVLMPPRLLMDAVVDVKAADKTIEKSHLNQYETIKVPAAGSWLSMPVGRYDLTGVSSLRFGGWNAQQDTKWTLQVRAGSATGELLGEASWAGGLNSYGRTPIKITPREGFEDLYLLVRSEPKNRGELQLFDMSFHQ
jgi:cytochrome c